MSEIAVIIPPELGNMVEKLLEGFKAEKSTVERLQGWLDAGAEEKYRELIKRDGIPNDPKVIKLLCEIAVLHALVRWHEVRNIPPPMPSISSL